MTPDTIGAYGTVRPEYDTGTDGTLQQISYPNTIQRRHGGYPMYSSDIVREGDCPSGLSVHLYPKSVVEWFTIHIYILIVHRSPREELVKFRPTPTGARVLIP